MSKIRSIDWVRVAAIIIVYGFMAGAARFSYTHIVDLFEYLGCSPDEAAWAPVYIDGFAFLGWLGRRRRFSEPVRRAGLRIMCSAGVLSGLCNIFAGHTWGSRGFGALIVGGFAVCEQYADRLTATSEPAGDAPELLALRTALADAESTAATLAEHLATAQAETAAARTAAAKDLRALKTRTTKEIKAMRAELAAYDYLSTMAADEDSPAQTSPAVPYVPTTGTTYM